MYFEPFTQLNKVSKLFLLSLNLTVCVTVERPHFRHQWPAGVLAHCKLWFPLAPQQKDLIVYIRGQQINILTLIFILGANPKKHQNFRVKERKYKSLIQLWWHCLKLCFCTVLLTGKTLTILPQFLKSQFSFKSIYFQFESQCTS